MPWSFCYSTPRQAEHSAGEGCLSLFDGELDRGAFLVVEGDLLELGQANDLDIVLFEIPSGDGDRFHGLVDRTRANRSQLGTAFFTNDASNSTGH